MKRRLLMALAALSVFLLGGVLGVARGATVYAFLSGSDYQALSETNQAYYLMGVSDALTVQDLESARACNDSKYGSTEVTASQLREVVARYLDGHPKAMNYSAASVIASAIAESCQP